jgi:hypothetical protein
MEAPKMKISARSALGWIVLFSFSILLAIALRQRVQEKNAKQTPAGPAAANAGQSSDQEPAPGTCELSEEDYAVFTGILEGLGRPEHPEETWKGKEILVSDVTGQAKIEDRQLNRWRYPSDSNPAPAAETRVDFIAKGKDECPLKEAWGDPKLYKPLSRKEVSGYFDRKDGRKHDGWKDFYARHPRTAGFWTFSHPGYNSAKDEALLYVVHSCGWLCGTGHLYFLAREKGKWNVKNKLFLWIA